MEKPKIHSREDLLRLSKADLFSLARAVGIIYDDKVEEMITKEELADTILLEGQRSSSKESE